ncbi:Hsp20 family protein [Hellea sp.]|nr:Hsp20 family protein [Hellea sp.]
MRTYDFSPLYRSFVGFDRMAGLIDAASQQAATGNAYPPYNVAQLSENAYRIELAVAGFAEDELELESHENVLTIKGGKVQSADNDDAEYLHRGIAERGFERRFQLADHVVVEGAELKNGLLVISLKRELPEALKPRKFSINDGKLIQAKPSGKAKAA